MFESPLVFLSYATPDRGYAVAACDVLERGKISCWIFDRDSVGGKDYGTSLFDAIDRCKVMVLFLSASANRSPHVRREAERAVSRGLKFVVCRVQEVKPQGYLQYACNIENWLESFSLQGEEYELRLIRAVELAIAGHLEGREDGSSSGPRLGRGVGGRRSTSKRFGLALANLAILSGVICWTALHPSWDEKDPRNRGLNRQNAGQPMSKDSGHSAGNAPRTLPGASLPETGPQQMGGDSSVNSPRMTKSGGEGFNIAGPRPPDDHSASIKHDEKTRRSELSPTGESERDVAKLTRSLREIQPDWDKVVFFKSFCARRHFTCKQATALLGTFTSDIYRADAAVLLYANLVDPDNFYQVLSIFDTDMYESQVQDHLQLHNKVNRKGR